MPIPAPPPIPHAPVPIHVDGVMEIQKSALRWARFAVVASLLAAAVFLFLAWRALIPWYLAVPFFLAPILPIAVQTRLEELARKVEQQVRERTPAQGEGEVPATESGPGDS